MSALKMVVAAYACVLATVGLWIVFVHVTRRSRRRHWSERYQARLSLERDSLAVKRIGASFATL